jgi:hypothetical protein
MVRLLMGFQVSQALFTLLELGIPDLIADRDLPVADLAEVVGADPHRLARLLRVLAMFGVVAHPSAGVVRLTDLGQTLTKTAADSVRDLALVFKNTHYQPFAHLTGVVRGGPTGSELAFGQPFFTWLATQPALAEQFTAGMANFAHLRLAAFDAYHRPARLIVDVGGADGTVLTRLLHTRPQAHGIVYDLPHVIPEAIPVLAAAGLTDRTQTIGGSFFDQVPGGGDLYVLSLVLHDWDDERAVAILRTIRRAIPTDAALIVVEALLPDGDDPHPAKLMDLNMLGVLTGQERTQTQYQHLLTAAGFHLHRVIETNQPRASILEAIPT